MISPTSFNNHNEMLKCEYNMYWRMHCIPSFSSFHSAAISADLGRQKALKGNAEALSTVTGIIDGTGSLGAAIGQVAVPHMQVQFGWRVVFYLFMASTFLTAVCISRIFVMEVRDIFRKWRCFCSAGDSEALRVLGSGEEEEWWWVSGQYLLMHQTFCNQTPYCDASSWARMTCKRTALCIFKVKVTARFHIDQNMTISQLLILLHPNLVWWWKSYCIQGQGHIEGSKCQNCWTVCNQTLYGDAST